MLTRPYTLVDAAEWAADQTLGQMANALPHLPARKRDRQRGALEAGAALDGGTAVPAEELDWMLEGGHRG
jgi:hypothetical protein